MGWLGRLLGAASKEEMEGIRLDTGSPHWEVDGPNTFEELFRALADFFPEDAVLYFEGDPPHGEISDFMAKHSIPEVSHVAMGTIWPRPKAHHVPATTALLAELEGIMKRHAEPELAIHFHVYRGGEVLLEWHDAFSQPMLMSASIPEEKVRAFSERIGKGYRTTAQ